MGAGYLWFDSEFSHDDLDRASLLQVALVATDEGLKVKTAARPEGLLDDEARPLGLATFVRPPSDVVVSAFVLREQADVLASARRRGREPSEVDAMLCAWTDAIFGRDLALKDRPILAGNSIHIDWALMRRSLPGLASRLHYRVLDVTALKMEWQRAGGSKFDKESIDAIRRNFPSADVTESARHDAYYDVQASIAELAFYRAGVRSGGLG
jgi:oligoribonuclease (3'-5' exoribonuclease)